MTKISPKEECFTVLEDIQKQYGNNPWFISGALDSDDTGIHVVVKVDAKDVNREKIRHPNKSVKICIYLIQR